MNGIEKAKALLELSYFNPKFKNNYVEVKNELIAGVPGHPRVECKQYILALNEKTGIIPTDISNALKVFKFVSSDRGLAGNLFERITINELLFTRKICYKFTEVINTIFSRGYLNSDTKVPAAFAYKTNQELKQLYENKSEDFWKIFSYYKPFLLNVAKRNFVTSAVGRTLVDDLELYEQWYSEESNFRFPKDSEVKKSNLFGGDKGKIDLNLLLFDLDKAFLAHPLKLKDTLIALENKFKEMLDNKSISEDEYRRYRSILYQLYNTYISPISSISPETIIEFYYDLTTKDMALLYLLQYTKDELFTAYEFAKGFCNCYTDEFIERELTNYLYITNRNLVLNSGDINASIIEKNTIGVLKLLLDNGVIDLDKYSKYKKELVDDVIRR